jgi:FkbM family methyltransferase
MPPDLKIIICGMPRSMTTWIFNVAAELLSDNDVQTLWIAPDDQDAEGAFTTSKGICLAKCHHYSKTLAEHADLTIYSFRDIRAVAVSCYRKFDLHYSSDEITSWLDAHKQWTSSADISIRYEIANSNKESTLVEIKELINNISPHLQLHEDELMLHKIDKKFTCKQTSESNSYSPKDMVLGQHRTFQPDPAHLSGIEKQIYQQTQEDFSTWLQQNGYITMDEYGQEIEYNIAREFFSQFKQPYVVDIGVERGSFIDLAIKSGAGKVDGFEPLPRHLDNLRKKYEASNVVSINPYAVSNETGSAQFHVATDNDGNELDYHHTLSDLGDSSTVNRSNTIVEVKTCTLKDFFSGKPEQIDFLKIDTDGHDLNVLHGLGSLRPTIIMAEYWNDLPETSGANSYTLEDLVIWAESNGYPESVIVRRNGSIEVIERNMPWSISGDWGNVFFVHQRFDFNNIKTFINEQSKKSYQSICSHVNQLIAGLEEKEAVIQEQLKELQTKESVIQEQKTALLGKQAVIQEQLKELQTKESVIQEQKTVLLEKQAVAYELSKSICRQLIHRCKIIPIYFKLKFNRLARPRLGWLRQYSPRPLKTPPNDKVVLTHSPKLSIVTPSYGQANFIERTINSVLNQEYPNLEYFIQDGGSTDGTVEVLKKNGHLLTGWKSEPDNGQSQAINRGFLNTSGEIMAWLNSDDLLLPGAINTVIEYFNQHPHIDVVYGNRLMIDDDDMEIGRWILPDHCEKTLAWADYIPQETLFWRRSIWEKAGGKIDESFQFAMDWDLLMRFYNVGATFGHIPQFLGAFRVHSQQKTSAEMDKIGLEEMNIIRTRELGYTPTIKNIRKSIFPFMLRHFIVDLKFRIKQRYSAARS